MSAVTATQTVVRVVLCGDVPLDRVARAASDLGHDVTVGTAHGRTGAIEVELVTPLDDVAHVLSCRTGMQVASVSSWPYEAGAFVNTATGDPPRACPICGWEAPDGG